MPLKYSAYFAKMKILTKLFTNTLTFTHTSTHTHTSTKYGLTICVSQHLPTFFLFVLFVVVFTGRSKSSISPKNTSQSKYPTTHIIDNNNNKTHKSEIFFKY